MIAGLPAAGAGYQTNWIEISLRLSLQSPNSSLHIFIFIAGALTLCLCAEDVALRSLISLSDIGRQIEYLYSG